MALPKPRESLVWVKPHRGGGLQTRDRRWRLIRSTIHSTWTLTDRRTGYRRHFATAPDAMTFVRTYMTRTEESHG